MIVAGLGLAAFLYTCIRERRIQIPRIVLISGLLAFLFSLWCLFAVTAAETFDLEYVMYPKSFFTWLLGAYEGEVEGAMSSLSIALAGILTVAAASVFATLL